ncbi:hypothetical protein [Candidatus Odyssella acanthamoebae]|uniref:Uncharacterized protein n=1 Tax=Candidatus Odyssella acanthamoebae TaxID=91604 RepID=A0A077AVK4_9PROT|nr:hypothetical protein [Candidatus Paracaedibacter acanthamoebae]AIK95693.1 hypothetical protein ID47_01470 [Candidatus Paracaedibacter acanthamoebae]
MTKTMTKTKQPEFFPSSNTMIANTTGINPTLNTSTIPIDTQTSLSITLTNDLGQAFTFNTTALSGSINPNKVPFYITISSNLLTSEEFSALSISSITDGSGNSIAFTSVFTSTQGFNYLCISPNNNLILQNDDYLTINLTMEASANPVGSTGDLTFGLYGEKSNGGHYSNNGVGLPLTLINSSTSGSRLTDQLTVTIGGGQGSNPGSNVIYVSDSTDPIINNLTLTLTNNDPSHPLVTTPVAGATPQFTISFITCGDTGDGSVNALGTSSNIEGILINEVTGIQGGYGWQKPSINTQGLVTTWTLTPDSTNTGLLGPGGSFNIPINDIISYAMPGTTMLYLTYVNIGGYADGSITVPIMKAPSQPTILSFSTDKDSYEFFETVTFNSKVFGASQWTFQINDPSNHQIYYNSDLSGSQVENIPVDFLAKLGDPLLSNLGIYTAKLSNTSGKVETDSLSFTLQNTSTVAINSLNIATDQGWDIQNSSININWNVPDSIPKEGFSLTLWVTAINNGKTLPTPVPINLSNNLLPSQTGSNVELSLSGNLENLQPFDSTQPLTFTLQLMYKGSITVFTATTQTTLITSPLCDLRLIEGGISVDSSGKLLPYASYLSTQWFPPASGEEVQVSIGSYDAEGNYYPLTYAVDGNDYGGSDASNLYTLPATQTSKKFLITSLNPTSAGSAEAICLSATPVSIQDRSRAFSINPTFQAIEVGAPRLILGHSQIQTVEVPGEPPLDPENTYLTINWDIPGSVTDEDFFIAATLVFEGSHWPLSLSTSPSANLSSYSSQYSLSASSGKDTKIYMSLPDSEINKILNEDQIWAYLQVHLYFGNTNKSTLIRFTERKIRVLWGPPYQ